MDIDYKFPIIFTSSELCHVDFSLCHQSYTMSKNPMLDKFSITRTIWLFGSIGNKYGYRNGRRQEWRVLVTHSFPGVLPLNFVIVFSVSDFFKI